MLIDNLNEIKIEVHNNPSIYERKSHAKSVDGTVHAYFDHLEQNLIEHILRADIVVGCVAWLTSGAILEALSTRVGVSIVIQKEDFLRPDISTRIRWTQYLRDKYDQLPSTLDRMFGWSSSTILGELSTSSSYEMDAIRTVGNYNSDKVPAFPRSHHKFVVFCSASKDWREDWEDWERVATPYAVWTGSFNFTENAARSLENALVLTDPNIVQAYMEEFAHVYALSEPLDWEAEWVEPEYRIGT